MTHLRLLLAAWPFVLACALGGTLVAALILTMLPTKYRAEAVVLIPSETAGDRLEFAAAWKLVPRAVLPRGVDLEIARARAKQMFMVQTVARDPEQARVVLDAVLAWAIEDARVRPDLIPRDPALIRPSDLEPPRVLRGSEAGYRLPKPWVQALIAGCGFGFLGGWAVVVVREYVRLVRVEPVRRVA